MEEDFIEHPLKGRGKLTYDWLLDNINNLLDVGCAYGYYTRFYLNKCKKIYGIDPNEDFIRIAKEKYPRVEFKVASAENLPFKENYFDVVLLNDVLEHVENEEKTLNEVYRVVKEKGVIILTVPHKGLLRFMDVDNYSWFVRNNFPKLYKLFNKIRRKKIKIKHGYVKKHKHYSIKDIEKLFDEKFKIEKFTRRGLFDVIVCNIELLVRTLLGEKICNKIKIILDPINYFDYKFNYGKLSGSLGVYGRKI